MEQEQFREDSLVGLRVFVYNELPPERREGFDFGLLLFNPKSYQNPNFKHKPVIQCFKLSALLNRDFYTLAQELVCCGLGNYFFGFESSNARENLIRQISDYLSRFNFVRMPCVRISHVPLLVFVLDFPVDVSWVCHHPFGIVADAKYIRRQRLDEQASIADRDGKLNILVSKSHVHAYLKTLEIEDYDDDVVDVEEFNSFLDTLREYCCVTNPNKNASNEEELSYEENCAQVANAVAYKTFFEIPPLLELIQTKQQQQFCDDDDCDTCAICLDRMCDEVEIARFARCKHVFHSHCISKWITNKPSCPSCRSSITFLC